ncbi:Crp/Fnr family transcriptional regulator [Pseudocolwellia sp. HL-MZ7]|uniref:Crp/Fnr family transcriptional regulator n=1 Tax=Pseudocolwellia sp. HL-MZ7 TaxID=3400627 RepID=UPI003CE8C0A3
MIETYTPIGTNQLLNCLTTFDRQLVLQNCERVELIFGEKINVSGKAIKYVYFPITCSISSLVELDEKKYFGMGLIGNEGMLGATLALGNKNAPMSFIVQCSGSALQMDASLFRHQLKNNLALRKLILNYLYIVLQQLAQTGACNNFHEVKQRLARWLLMTQDRTQSDHFYLTHQYLAKVMGVRRSAVTIAAGYLQQQGVISYKRGQITVLSRSGLEKLCCECYFADIHSYQRILTTL